MTGTPRALPISRTTLLIPGARAGRASDLTVLAAKVTTFVEVVFVVGLITSSSAFGIGQAIFSSEGIQASLSDPGWLRAVIGGALYVAPVGVLGLGLGSIVRRPPERSPHSSRSW